MNSQLRKACDLAQEYIGSIVKSQHDHHIAYTRTSQGGAVSNVSEKGPQQTLDGLKHHDAHDGTTFDQRLAGYGRKNNVDHQEIARAMSASHASEVAYSTGSQEAHGRAYYEHVAASAEARDPVFQLHHMTAAKEHHSKAFENTSRRVVGLRAA